MALGHGLVSLCLKLVLGVGELGGEKEESDMGRKN